MMTLLRNPRVIAGAMFVTVMTVTSSAQQQSATSSPAAAQAQQVDRYVVGQAQPPVRPGVQVMSMTLEQAMAMALENNLDLKVARVNPQLVDYQMQSARAAFLPRFSSTYSINNSTTPSNNVLQGVNNVTQNTQNFNGSMSQVTPWHGGSFTANFTNSRNGTNDVTSRLNPQFSSRLNFSYTQPLLAGFRMDNTRNSLRTTAIQRQIADITLLATIENTKASVRTAYWNLRQAIEQIEIQKRSLELAQRLLQENRTKVEIGTMAPIDTVQPEANVATSEQALLNAEISWRTAELNLKRLLASGPEVELYRATINPTEQATLSVQSVDIPSAVTNALASRTDIVQQRKNIESAQLTLEVTKDATRPQLDLSTGYNTSGQGGTRFNQGVITEETGYTGALRNLVGLDTSGWNAGVTLALPFGRDITVNRVNYTRALLQLEQSKAQIEASILTISADVTNAGLNVENTYKQFQAAQKSRAAQEANAEAAQTRFDVGMSTNFEVVQAQNNLTSARLTELSRLIAYLNAIAEFDRIQRVGR